MKKFAKIFEVLGYQILIKKIVGTGCHGLEITAWPNDTMWTEEEEFDSDIEGRDLQFEIYGFRNAVECLFRWLETEEDFTTEEDLIKRGNILKTIGMLEALYNSKDEKHKQIAIQILTGERKIEGGHDIHASESFMNFVLLGEFDEAIHAASPSDTQLLLGKREEINKKYFGANERGSNPL